MTPPPAQANTRNIQRLLRQIPGLVGMVSAPIPPVPPEIIAAPAPPLGPPLAGLPAAPANWFAYHVLNRVTYGGTPNQLNTISRMNAAQADDWANRFMKEQLGLNPNLPWPTNLHSTSPLSASIPIIDTDTDQMLAAAKSHWSTADGLPDVLSPSLTELQDQDLTRKLYSRRQLLEKMVYFWDNHFSTNYRTHGAGQFEMAENEAFRTNAFGKFLDLLTVSAKSSAMMIYLNTDVNRKENPNENYARELQELRTLGVDANGNPNGYTQADIVEAAKTFTGWTTLNVARPGFRFVSGRHSPGSKTFLGQTIGFDGNGPGEGEQVLAIASQHPSTAKHLAKKLCVYFVSDTPSQALLDEVAAVFADSSGDIKKVLIAIFTSPDFRNVANYRARVKTPLEFVAGLHRNLGVWSSINPFRDRLVRMGQGMFEKPEPTGYKEAASEWLNTDILFNEVGFAYEATIPGFGSTIIFGTDASGGLTRVWLKNLGLKTEEDVLGFLLNVTLDRVVTATEYQVYLTTLRSAGGTFSLDNSNVETSLDRMLATILASPRYKYL
ncbi:MAG: DUF1800 domain-containing protein [Nitrospirae bacterium]|nr:DUF1800 domain-containing protein [Nitrospirota bacterium]